MFVRLRGRVGDRGIFGLIIDVDDLNFFWCGSKQHELFAMLFRETSLVYLLFVLF